MVNDGSTGQVAPGRLEDVRTLLNSWLIPNDTRVAQDWFGTYAEERHVPGYARDALRQLRDDLRSAVERTTGVDDVLNAWLDRLEVRPHVTAEGVEFRHAAGLVGEIVTVALAAVASHQWARLKACPDCRWVFYDHTRNGSKRWCLMTAGGPDGRSCGSIAKVRSYRERARRA